MINLHKQHKLKQLTVSQYKQFLNDIDYINAFIPKLQYVDFRLFDGDDDYNRKIPRRRRSEHFEYNDDCYPLAQDFLDAVTKMENILPYYPLKVMPLFLELLADSMDACSLWGFPTDETNFYEEEIRQLNHCVSEIKHLLNDKEVLKEVKRIQFQEMRQNDSVKDYIEDLFHCYARLEVIRIDLGYRSENPIRYSKVHRHRELMIRYLREKHFGHAHVGYIWKLEYGFLKSYHLHMVIFMDGSKVQQSVLHAQKIGAYWNEVITHGKGTSFNCNAKQDRYQDNGIGTINYFDETKINALYVACNYLTIFDPYIDFMQQAEARLLLCEDNLDLSTQIANGRVFGKGQLPKLRPRLGRPRMR